MGGCSTGIILSEINVTVTPVGGGFYPVHLFRNDLAALNVSLLRRRFVPTNPAFTYAWTVSPNGDGTAITGSGSTESFTPQSFTTYTISVVATDVSGQFATNSIDVPVTP